MPHYLTPEGAKRYATELNQLLTVERPRIVQEVADAAAQGDRSENAEYIYGKKRLREIDRRVRFLTKRLESAVVVKRDEETSAPREVRFGATVAVRDENGKEGRYTIVGPDEADPSKGRISRISSDRARLLRVPPSPPTPAPRRSRISNVSAWSSA